MGTLYKRSGSKNWMMAVIVGGRQRCKSTHTSNKRLADQLLSRWEAEVFEGRFQLLKSNPPRFESWADDFLKTVSHPNTRRRYTSSVRNLKSQFKGRSIADISLDCVEEYKDARLASGIGPATVNRDLTVLRKMLRLAGRKRFIPPSRFVEVERLEEIEQRRAPHIVTFQEEEKILPIAPPHIRALMVLILETGMRSTGKRSCSNGRTLTLRTAPSKFVSPRPVLASGTYRCRPAVRRNYSGGETRLAPSFQLGSFRTCKILASH